MMMSSSEELQAYHATALCCRRLLRTMGPNDRLGVAVRGLCLALEARRDLLGSVSRQEAGGGVRLLPPVAG